MPDTARRDNLHNKKGPIPETLCYAFFMFGPTIYFRREQKLALRGTPLWIPAVLLLIIAFSMGLAWIFWQSEELWFETGMENRLSRPSDSGFLMVSWPLALMSLALGLPWLLALSQVRLREVTLDAARGIVSVKPLGPLTRSARELSFGDIAALEVTRARPTLLRRIFGRSGAGTRPVLWLKTGDALALVGRPISRARSEKILLMARKLLPDDVSQGR